MDEIDLSPEDEYALDRAWAKVEKQLAKKLSDKPLVQLPAKPTESQAQQGKVMEK